MALTGSVNHNPLVSTMRMDWPICMRNGDTVTGCVNFEVKHLDNFAGTFYFVQITELLSNTANKILYYNVLQVREDLGQTVDQAREQAVKEALHKAETVLPLKTGVKIEIEADYGSQTATFGT